MEWRTLVGKKKRKVSSINLKKSNIKQKNKAKQQKPNSRLLSDGMDSNFLKNKKSHSYLMKMHTFFLKKEINKKNKCYVL